MPSGEYSDDQILKRMEYLPRYLNHSKVATEKEMLIGRQFMLTQRVEGVTRVKDEIMSRLGGGICFDRIDLMCTHPR